jgi:hypothetical protein
MGQMGSARGLRRDSDLSGLGGGRTVAASTCTPILAGCYTPLPTTWPATAFGARTKRGVSGTPRPCGSSGRGVLPTANCSPR